MHLFDFTLYFPRLGEGENPPIVDHSAEEGEYTHPLSSETSPDVSKDERSLYVATTTEMGGSVTELENPEVGGETTWNQYGGGGGGGIQTASWVELMTS